LNVLIKVLKISKKEFAERVGVPPQQISNYIRKNVQIKNVFANNIVAAFPQINIDYVLYGKGEPIVGIELESNHDYSKISEGQIEYMSKELEIIKRENELLREKLVLADNRIKELEKKNKL